MQLPNHSKSSCYNQNKKINPYFDPFVIFFQDFNAKLSDFGLATDGPEGDDTHITTRVMGTEGYAAPEYIMTGNASSFLLPNNFKINQEKSA